MAQETRSPDTDLNPPGRTVPLTYFPYLQRTLMFALKKMCKRKQNNLKTK